MNVTFRERGKSKIWYYRIKGAPLTKAVENCTGTNNRQVAMQAGFAKLEELRAAAKAGDLVDRPALTARMLCDYDVARAQSEATHGDYIHGRITYYWEALGTFYKDFYNVTLASIHDYVKFRVGPDPLHPRYKHQTIQRELHALIRGLKIAADCGHKVSIPSRIPKLKAHTADTRRMARSYTPEQMISFVGELMRIDGRGSSAPFALAIFALGTGMRHGELAAIDKVSFTTPESAVGQGWCMMIWPDGVRKSKRGGSMAVPNLVAQLVPYLPPSGYNYKGPWQRAAKRAGLPAVPTLRCLRHTFANAADRSGDPYGVDLAMDHARQVKGRYRHSYEERMARIMLAVMQGYAPIFAWSDPPGRQSGDKQNSRILDCAV